MSDRPRVVDFSTHLSGPMAGHLLCELGADVIKVENPRTGDGNRGLDPLIAGRGLFHLQLNSGARSLAVDRHSPEWDEVIPACVRWADAVIVGSRPIDARRRGLDYATLVGYNPELVYCSITGYGDEGPWQDLPAHGQTIDALAGLVPVEEDDAGNPTTVPGWRSAGATLAGVFGALGVFAGLYRQQRSGGGPQYVTTSLWGAAMWWSWRDLVALANLDEPWNDYGDLGSRYSMYWTADDRAVLVCPIERRYWERFCDVVDLPREWRSRGNWDESGMDFGDGPEHAHERARIAEQMRRRALNDWTARLAEAEIPFAPVLTKAEALASEHSKVTGVMRPVQVRGAEAEIVASPLAFAEEGQERAVLVPPELDENRKSVLAALGLDHLITATS